MVWHRVQNFALSWCIVIIVLLFHGALLYLLLQELSDQSTSHNQTKRIRETAPVFIMDAEEKQTTLQPEQTQTESVTQKTEKISPKNDSLPEPFDYKKPPEEMLFASLYQKENRSDESETIEAPNQENPEPIEKQKPIPLHPLSLVTELEKKEQKTNTLTPESIAPKKAASTPPRTVATDDIPFAFEGVHTTQLSAKDTLFHTFIKAVNTALYVSMQEGTPPFSPGNQPLVIRMIIVRTGRLAQRPTIVRSSGNINRDMWYIDSIVRASASFPPIPDALHLPFAEMMFKEGSRGQTP